MAKKIEVLEPKLELKPELVKTKTEAAKESAPLILQAEMLEVNTEEDYLKADFTRASLKGASKRWKDRLGEIIKPAYAALQSLYELQREIVDPMDKAVVIITGKMGDYKRKEFEAQENARRERERLEREKEEAQRKVDAAKTAAAARLISSKVDRVAEQIKEVERQELKAPVQADGSTTRIIKKWKVTDIKLFAAAIGRGEIPEDVIEIKTSVFNDYFNGDDDDKSAIKTWPGITVFEDVQIVSRRNR